MFSSRSHLLLICFSYLQSSILRLSLFQAAFVLNMQWLFFLPVWTFCKSADKKFQHFWCHGALLWLKENEENIHIFLLTASKSVILHIAIIMFQMHSWESEKNLRLLMPESFRAFVFVLLSVIITWHISPLIFPFYKKLGKLTFFFELILTKWKEFLNRTFRVCFFCRLWSKYN